MTGNPKVAATGLGVAIALLVVIGGTLLPGVGYWDTGEFQAVAPSLGIAHPTGYPLYILLGKLASTIPFGSIAWRMNVFSALCTALAGGGLSALLVRGGVGLPWAILAGAGYGWARNVWSVSTHADPHTLNAVWSVLLVAVAWSATESERWVAWWGLAFLMGLGLGNHMILVMALPGLVVALVLARPDWARSPRRWGAAVFAFACGLLVYAYLPLRSAMNPPLDYHHPVTWERFRYVAMGEQFRSDMGFLSVQGIQAFLTSLPRLGAWLVDWYTPGGAWILGSGVVLGFTALARRGAWPWVIGLGLAMAIPSYAAGTYANADLTRYYFIPQLVALATAAIGLDALWKHLSRHPGPGLSRLAWLVPLMALWLVKVHRPIVDQAWNTDADRYMRTIFSVVKPGAVIVSWWSLSTPLWYGQSVEGLRPDVLVLDESTLVKIGHPDPREAVRRFFGKRPVYVVHLDPQRDRIREQFDLRELPSTNGVGQTVYEVVGDGPRDLEAAEGIGYGVRTVSTTESGRDGR